jgi:cytochrome c oxidase subunit 2
MAQQLRNFRQGIRGGHPQDFPGSQMASMARPLRDDRSIDDLVSYVHPL